MEIVRRGIIPKPEQDITFSSLTFPCMVKLPSGRWLAACKAGEKKTDSAMHRAVIAWSDDEGRNWTTPFEPVQLPERDGVRFQSFIMYFLPLSGTKVLMVMNGVDASDPTKPFYNPENESLKDTRIFYSFSEDNGETWSQPLWMDTDPICAPVPLTGAPLLLGDGTVVCQFEVNKAEGDHSKWVHKSALIFSKDGGRSWGDVVIVTEEPDMYYWDQRPNVLADGRTIVNFFGRSTAPTKRISTYTPGKVWTEESTGATCGIRAYTGSPGPRSVFRMEHWRSSRSTARQDRSLRCERAETAAERWKKN